MKNLIALLAFLLPLAAHANGPIIWQGSNAKDLTTGGLITPNVLLPEGGTGADKITVKAPASIAAAYDLTLPTTNGDADQCMVTNGSGVLSFTKIANANVDASAAIDYSKLALTDSIVNADIDSAAAIAYSKLNLATSIVNADVAAAAAVARTKLAAGTASHVVVNDGDGVFSSEAQLALTRGGTAKSLTPDAGGVVWTDADSLEVAAAGSGGQLLMSNGTSAPGFVSTVTGATTFSSGVTGRTGSVASAFKPYNGGSAATGSSDSSSVTLQYHRVGTFVTLFIPGVTSADCGDAVDRLRTVTVIPDSFAIPATQQRVSGGQCRNNGALVATPCLISINTDGAVEILRDGAATAFTANTSCGSPSALTVTYYVGA